MTTDIFKLITKHDHIEQELAEISEELNMIAPQPLPNKPPIVLYFKDDPMAACVPRMLEKCRLVMCTTWLELSTMLQLDTKFLAIHIDTILDSTMGIPEWMMLLDHTTKVLGVRPLAIHVVIRKTTPLKVIKELKKTVVTGICLDISEYDIDDVNYAMDRLIAHQPHWPARIIDQLPGNVPKRVASIDPSDQLTARQHQVLDLIVSRGSNNKDIARILGISPNTVKIHIGNIMKLYGVRTRLQLALSAKPKN